MIHRLRLLTIAGSDCSGGAGIQADLKTFAAHGAYGMSVVTAVTAQNTMEVLTVEILTSALVADQLAAVLDDIGVDGVKIGMLGDAQIVKTVAAALGNLPEEVPVVLDPVLISKSGARLLTTDAIDSLRRELVPRASLLTPNLPEAQVLTGSGPEDGRERLLVALGRLGTPVLLKGGHDSDAVVDDVLVSGDSREHMLHPRQQTRNTHGTGCTLSSAITVRMARGESLLAAVRGGIDFVQSAMAAGLDLGRGHGPLDHLVRLEGPDL